MQIFRWFPTLYMTGGAICDLFLVGLALLGAFNLEPKAIVPNLLFKVKSK